MFKKALSLILVLSLVLAVGACTKQTGGRDVSVPVKDIAKKIAEDLQMGEMVEMPEEMAVNSYPFDRSIVSEYVINQAMFNINSDEIAIFKVKDEAKIADIEKAIKNRVDELEKTWSEYLPDQYEKVKNHKVIKSGKYVMFAITTDQAKVEEIFNSFMK